MHIVFYGVVLLCAVSKTLCYLDENEEKLPTKCHVESVTFKTLKGLKKRGVKVDLGFPDQMWDTPDAEVTRLKNRCEYMVEQHEDDITEWYWNHPDENLTQWLCIERVLNSHETDCLEGNQNKEVSAAGSGMEKKSDKEKGEMDEKKVNKDRKVKDGAQKKSKKMKKSSRENKMNKKDRGESDSEKIQRLIREQTEQQAKRFGEQPEMGKLTKAKRDQLRKRLSAFFHTKGFRAKLREIRQELSDDEYFPTQPWIENLDAKYHDEVISHMRRHAYERITTPEEFRREVELRMASTGLLKEHSEVQKLGNVFLEEASTVRDPNEIRDRLKDLDALSAILGKSNGIHEEL
ncbi:uncharacterized protein LOC5506890 isoform X2 [Nematostella vectensis]|uniref:uncharacterized protein LOC5506890 isoform X2 n=1 Tax=Nematostella vectensis TaxID=45351 RepID=UPI00138FA90D|nr:uncharacterized protein LOC5506890 isoform X2 [Nematostella vectensis]